MLFLKDCSTETGYIMDITSLQSELNAKLSQQRFGFNKLLLRTEMKILRAGKLSTLFGAFKNIGAKLKIWITFSLEVNRTIGPSTPWVLGGQLVWTPQPSKVGQFSGNIKNAEICRIFTYAKNLFLAHFFEMFSIEDRFRYFHETNRKWQEAEPKYLNLLLSLSNLNSGLNLPKIFDNF